MALRLRDELAWKNFLMEANIPDEIAADYAKILVENRLTEAILSHLTAENLTAINITVLGDILSILDHIKTTFLSSYVRTARRKYNVYSRTIQASTTCYQASFCNV